MYQSDAVDGNGGLAYEAEGSNEFVILHAEPCTASGDQHIHSSASRASLVDYCTEHPRARGREAGALTSQLSTILLLLHMNPHLGTVSFSLSLCLTFVLHFRIHLA
jgi:hypothetical protein